MTQQEAIAILNRERHNGCSTWVGDDVKPRFGTRPEEMPGYRTPFEVLAIAEKYERDRVAGEERKG